MSNDKDIDARALMDARYTLADYVGHKAKEAVARLGFGFRPSASAPDTWVELKREHRCCVLSKAPLRISNQYTDDIYPTDASTFAYRFWHDTTHVRFGLSFTPDDECEAADYHLTQLRLDGFSTVSFEYRMMHADTMGQVVLLAQTGHYPRCQYDFVLNVLVRGLDEAIAIEERHALRQAASS